jgi:hypothetical protein
MLKQEAFLNSLELMFHPGGLTLVESKTGTDRGNSRDEWHFPGLAVSSIHMTIEFS